jgi:hypothetical protein
VTKRTQRRIVIKEPAGSAAEAAYCAVVSPVQPIPLAMPAPRRRVAPVAVDIGRERAFDLPPDRRRGVLPALAGVRP